jgi:hypothetical protein
MGRHSRRAWLRASGSLLVAAAAADAGIALAAPSVRLQLITAKSNPLRNVTFPELRQLYHGKRISLAGLKVLPFNHPPGTPDRTGFDRLVLGMGPEEVARYWIDQRVRGGDTPPRTVDSVALLLRVIATLNGSFGYVREGFMSPDLKVVSLEGKLPSDAGYPLVF